MLDFITRFFKREETSKTLAKERLRLVLMSDRVSLAPDTFDEMKGELLSVIRRYLEIDERALDMHFENLERQFALLASIPVLKVRTADEVRAMHADGVAVSNGAVAANGSTRNGTASANGVPRSPSSRRRRRRRRTTTSTEDGSPSENGSSENGMATPDPPPEPLSE